MDLHGHAVRGIREIVGAPLHGVTRVDHVIGLTHKGVDGISAAEVYDVDIVFQSSPLGNVHLLTGHDEEIQGQILVMLDGIKRGIVPPVIGDNGEIVAVLAVVCTNVFRHLTAVGATGVHMEVSHEGVPSHKILVDCVYAELHHTPIL